MASGGAERRGTVLGIVLVVAMAAGVLALGLSGAFPDRRSAAAPVVTVAGRLPTSPRTGRAYRLTPPPLDRDDARRIFAAVGVRARIGAARGAYFVRDGVGAIVRTPSRWNVSVFTGPPRPRGAGGPPPTEAEALATAGPLLDELGVARGPASVSEPSRAGTRTVSVDRIVGGQAIPTLGWSVVVAPGPVVSSVSGSLTDVSDAGRVPLEPAASVARRLPAARSAEGVDHLALWAVTVGTNMMGYTPVFGSSVKYVLLGKREICPSIVTTGDGKTQTRVAFVSTNVRCAFRGVDAVTVLRGVPASGVVTVGRGNEAFVVPSYRFTYRTEPAGGNGPQDITVAAVSDRTLARLRAGSS